MRHVFNMLCIFIFFYIRYKFRGHYLGTKSYMTLRLRWYHIHWPLWPQQSPEQINLSEPHTSSSLALVLALMLFLFCVFCSWYLHTDASSITNLYHPGHAAIEDIMQILPELDALFVEEGVTFAREDLVNTVPWSMSLGFFDSQHPRSNGCWRVGSWYNDRNDDVWKTV